MINLAPDWLEQASRKGFGVDHLPYGIANFELGPKMMAAIGQYAFDIATAVEEGIIFMPGVARSWAHSSNLNLFLSLGREEHKRLRKQLQDFLVTDRKAVGKFLCCRSSLELTNPLQSQNFVDFYSSQSHAERCAMIPGNSAAISDAWPKVPLGYYSRAGKFSTDGDLIVRPSGVVNGREGPVYRPARMLDFELELGAVVRNSTTAGHFLAADDFDDAAFGFVLLNDWSARDLQQFEAQPLGPFQSKSFATQTAAWITPVEALEPFLIPVPQSKNTLPHLKQTKPCSYQIELTVTLQSAEMRKCDDEPIEIATCSFEDLHWTPAQQLAHLTANGAPVSAGDLLGSGTISGPKPIQMGCLLERLAMSLDAITLPDGTTRKWLHDGDTIGLHAFAQQGSSFLQLAAVSGTVEPAALRS